MVLLQGPNSTLENWSANETKPVNFLHGNILSKRCFKATFKKM